MTGPEFSSHSPRFDAARWALVQQAASDPEVRMLVEWRLTAPDEELLDDSSPYAELNETLAERTMTKYGLQGGEMTWVIDACEAAITFERG